MSDKELTHIGKHGKAEMVDISEKSVSKRVACASGIVVLPESIFCLIENNEIMAAKGPVFNTAVVAATMAVKNTAQLIPFCHQIAIEACTFNFDCNATTSEVTVFCEVSTQGKTGAEMEALTGVSVACLTIYDMCKAISPLIEIKDIRLIHKSGGKNDFKRA